MDAHSLEILEFPSIRDLLAARCACSLGREKVQALGPMTDLAAIQESIGRVGEMVEALSARLEPPLGGLRDLRTPLRRAELGVLLEVDQALEFRDLFDLTGRVYEYWLRLGTDYPRLERLLADVEDLRHLARAIDATIDREGKVRDAATPELAQVRAELAGYEERIQTELRRLLRQPEVRKALRYSQATLSGDHHVLPVAVNYRRLVPGVVHRVSSSGETIFIEPARVAELSAEVVLLRSAEAREVRRVLRQLTSQIARDARRIHAAIEVLGEVDFLVAKARYSRDFSMTAPAVEEGGSLRLVDARHPLLMEIKRIAGEDPLGAVVPIGVSLGESTDVLLVTGPNTGGKTVALKTVGLAVAMALSGLHIAARAGSRTPLLENVLVDIGDEQSMEQSLSTFSAHMARIAQVLKLCGPRTLVLLDELGAGTDPSEGAALGRAILDELVEQKALAMVTTHLGDLKTYALARPRVENAAVEFDAANLRPTYRLIVGQFGQSCALKIARRLDLPRPLILRARKYLRRRQGRQARELGELQQLRANAERAREEARAARVQAEAAADDLRRRADQIQQEAKISEEIERFRAGLRPGDVVRVLRFDKNGTVVRVDARRKQAAVTVGAVEWQLPLEELLPLPALRTDRPH